MEETERGEDDEEREEEDEEEEYRDQLIQAMHDSDNNDRADHVGRERQ